MLPRINRVIEKVENEDPDEFPQYVFFCPGCGCDHGFNTSGKPPVWGFNDDLVYPTVIGSIKVTGREYGRDTVCHLFINAGQIQYLNDCTHALSGKTIPMEPYDDAEEATETRH